ncbi:MAG: CopG family transcriptional regulator [Hadesarchaea archaeon B3_Hades]|nr:MAG: CopG family transcriptional regulator [Hadesarchaea archaeon B3_Hades]
MPARKERVNTTFTTDQTEGLDRLVEDGVYLDRGSAIRDAVRLLLGMHGVAPFYPEGE